MRPSNSNLATRHKCQPERPILSADASGSGVRTPYRSTQGAAMSSYRTVRLVVADTTGSSRPQAPGSTRSALGRRTVPRRGGTLVLSVSRRVGGPGPRRRRVDGPGHKKPEACRVDGPGCGVHVCHHHAQVLGSLGDAWRCPSPWTRCLVLLQSASRYPTYYYYE